MSLITKNIRWIAAAFIVLLAGVAFFPNGAFSGTTNTDENGGSLGTTGRYIDYTFFSATTTSATSTNIVAAFDAAGRLDTGAVDTRGAESATFYFSRGGSTGANTGLTVFSVEGTPDGTNWYDVNRLITNDVTGTATSTYTINAATSTAITSVDLTQHNFKQLRCIALETTDGDHTCRATISW